jgi:hypothetical protein
MVHAGAFSTRAGTAPPLFELPMTHKIYLSVMEFGLTFLFAMVVINCVLSILIDLYTGLRKRHQNEAAAAEKDNPLFMVHNLPLMPLFKSMLARMPQSHHAWPRMRCTCVGRKRLACSVQAWSQLPAKKEADLPRHLLPLLSYSKQLAAPRRGDKKDSTKAPGDECGDKVSVLTLMKVVREVKQAVALMRYAHTADESRKATALPTGNETRFLSIAQLLVEAWGQNSKAVCADAVMLLKDWYVDLPITALNGSPKTKVKSEEDKEEEKSGDSTKHANIGALALNEALCYAR